MTTGRSMSLEAGSSFRVFLIADVRGYTRFTQMEGDAAAARLATKFAWIAREAVAARSGRVIEPSAGPPAAPTLTRWNLRAGFLAARACSVARRNLTRLEWEQILPNLRYKKVCGSSPLTQ